MPSYIDKAELVGDRLTNSDMQRRVREMTGTEVYHEVLRIINEMSAAEVVRCRECLHNSNGMCRIMQLEMKPTDFCSYGKNGR